MTHEPSPLVPPDEDEDAKKDRIAMASVPAPFVDSWFLTTWRGHIRIALAENIADADYYRAAVVMDLDNARRLATAVLRMVDRRKLKDEQRAKDNADKAES
jgi:hypothetical protein